MNVGGAQGKENYLPAEVCEILERQPYKGKLLDDHTAEMIKVACKPPNINAAAIVNRGIRELGFVDQNDPLRAFGVSIGTEMAVVPGRILPSPNIRYATNAPRIDDRASWNLRDVKFAKGGKLENWAVLLIADGGRDEFQGPGDPALVQTVDGFVTMCRKSGVNVVDKPSQVVVAQLPNKTREQPIRGDAINTIRAALLGIKKKPSFVFVILSNGDRNVYSGLKHLCDVYLDVATICVQVSKFRKEKGQLQYFANVALKLNMKMGGVNHRMEGPNAAWLKKEPTMLVGIDVTHPGFGTVKGTPSIAAVVASVDADYGQFPASLRIQQSKQEVRFGSSDNLTSLTRILLLDGLRSVRYDGGKVASIPREEQRSARPCHRLPRWCLRGMSVVYSLSFHVIMCFQQGQFKIVVAEEMPEIRKAFTKVAGGSKYSPKLTIVICGKRHHTRFYPTEAQNAAGDGNPRPGTVVDRGVVAVYEFDFFLQGQPLS